MAAATWEFVKRHKGKLIAGGVLVGGGVAYFSQNKITNTSAEGFTADNDHLKVQARRHYVFDTNHRSCDQSIVDLAPSLKQLVQSRFDVDSLIRTIQNGEDLGKEEKLEIWQRIKTTSIGRMVALAYSYSLLTVTLKAQISILAAEICAQFESPARKTSAWSDFLPSQVTSWFNSAPPPAKPDSMAGIDAGSRQIFLQCIQFFTTKGIFRLFDIVEIAAKEECSTVSLRDDFNRDSLRDLLERVDSKVSQQMRVEFPQMVAPITTQEAVSGDAVMKLLSRLLSALESSWCTDTTSSLVDLYFSAACHKLPTAVAPLARILPSLADTFEPISATSFDSPLQNTLCSSDIHRFAMNVFNMLK